MESPTPNGHTQHPHHESTSSTPFASAPSSPTRAPGFINGGFFYSAPPSPTHFAPALGSSMESSSKTQPSSPDFEFSARFEPSGPGQTGSMSSADELFLNGKIRPMKLSTHLEKPQVLAPLLDLEHEEDEEQVHIRKSSSLRRRTRSMSPLRTDTNKDSGRKVDAIKAVRSSKRWVFLKDFLRKKTPKTSGGELKKRRVPVPVPVPETQHELVYTANRAEAEEMRKKTFLPYRQGLFGCLGFSSKSCGAMNGLARALNQVN